jgi:hypothetical protein
MIYALIVVCSTTTTDFRLLEDTTGPHASLADCRARIDAMRPHVPGVAVEAGPGPWRVLAVCDRLDRVREIAPGAYAGEAMGVAL